MKSQREISKNTLLLWNHREISMNTYFYEITQRNLQEHTSCTKLQREISMNTYFYEVTQRYLYNQQFEVNMKMNACSQ
jgi:hypothetical protein